MPWSSSSGGGFIPCRARLPGKGGLSLDDILLLWLGLGPSDLLVGPSDLLVACTLSWVGASILILCMCTVRATDPWFVAQTEAPGPVPNVLPSVIKVGPNKCTGRVAEEAGLLRSSLPLQ